MERSSSFISLSGLSGITAGIIGLITCIILDYKIGAFVDYSKDVFLTPDRRSSLIVFCVCLSFVSLILTFLTVLFFTSRKAKKKNLPVWDGSARRLAVNLFIPLITGGIFCIILVYQYFDWLVIPSMLIFYGLALVNASKYTLSELLWLGICEILLGLLAVLFLAHSILFWGAGFGILNIIYGTMMYFKYERN